jgi:hypothetical protein
MKKHFFMLLGLLITPAMAEVAPVFYDDEVPTEYSDVDEVIAEISDTETVATPIKAARTQNVTSARNISSQSAISRTAPVSRATPVSGRASSGASGRVVAARSGANTSSRTVSAAGRTGTASRTTTNTTNTTTRTASPRVTNISRATTIGSVNTTTDPLYLPNSTRVSVRSNNGSVVGTRSPTIRVASATSLANTEVSASNLQDMDTLAEMTDYCKSQYAACMDNYCNVLDDNQGRCSCSANLKNYAKAESALKSATEELQEVAQKIQYIGLNANEIETLFTETEAELTMSNKTDSSQIKTSLDKIKDMLIEVRTGTATSSASSGLGFDLNGLLDFTIDSTGFDISSFLGGFGTSTNSVTNQRGEELYKTAQNRCKSAVLRNCTAQGIDANLITNSYDLQIDKECVLYERSLTDANDQMVATIRNAKSVLQRARLLVAKQKNVYEDMPSCINALDNCMQNEFVCGTDYENCLDPTGRYIVNGEIVIGSQPGNAIDPSVQYDSTSNSVNSVMTSDVCKVNLYRTWDMPGQTCQSQTSVGPNTNNAWGSGTNDTLSEYINQSVTSTAAQSSSINMAEFLQNKIGYVGDTRNYGMCISELNKCQDYTYKKNGTKTEYNPTNDVIKQYLARVLVQIKAKQDQILLDYADSCVSDVLSCLAQNNYPSTVSAAQSSVASNIAINACRPTIVTCMSVNGYSIANPTPTELSTWVLGISFPNPEYTITYSCDGETVLSTQTVSAGGSFVTKAENSCSPAVTQWTVVQSNNNGSRAASSSSSSSDSYKVHDCHSDNQLAPGTLFNYCWQYDIMLVASNN